MHTTDITFMAWVKKQPIRANVVTMLSILFMELIFGEMISNWMLYVI